MWKNYVCRISFSHVGAAKTRLEFLLRNRNQPARRAYIFHRLFENLPTHAVGVRQPEQNH